MTGIGLGCPYRVPVGPVEVQLRVQFVVVPLPVYKVSSSFSNMKYNFLRLIILS